MMAEVETLTEAEATMARVQQMLKDAYVNGHREGFAKGFELGVASALGEGKKLSEAANASS